MYPVPTNSILSMTFEGRVQNQQMMTVLHYKMTSAVTAPSGLLVLQNLWEKIKLPNELFVRYQACLSNMMSGMRVKMQWLFPIRYAGTVFTPDSTFGQIASPVPGSNLSVALTKRSDLANRHAIGTLHMPAVPTTFLQNGQLSPIAVDAYAELATLVSQPIELVLSAQTFTPVLFNSLNPAASLPVLEATPASYPRTMHRRTVGVGS